MAMPGGVRCSIWLSMPPAPRSAAGAQRAFVRRRDLGRLGELEIVAARRRRRCRSPAARAGRRPCPPAGLGQRDALPADVDVHLQVSAPARMGATYWTVAHTQRRSTASSAAATKADRPTPPQSVPAEFSRLWVTGIRQVSGEPGSGSRPRKSATEIDMLPMLPAGCCRASRSPAADLDRRKGPGHAANKWSAKMEACTPTATAGLSVPPATGTGDGTGRPGCCCATRAPARTVVLLQHRAAWSHHGDTWGLPGGARDSHETPEQAALREAVEESGLDIAQVTVTGEWVDDHGGWSYTTVMAAAPRPSSRSRAVTLESVAFRWVPENEVSELPLHPGFAATWPQLDRPADVGRSRAASVELAGRAARPRTALALRQQPIRASPRRPGTAMSSQPWWRTTTRRRAMSATPAAPPSPSWTDAAGAARSRPTPPMMRRPTKNGTMISATPNAMSSVTTSHFTVSSSSQPDDARDRDEQHGPEQASEDGLLRIAAWSTTIWPYHYGAPVLRICSELADTLT